ncbi:MAG: methyltransferase domain-containing protein [Burkholderiales bacterium]
MAAVCRFCGAPLTVTFCDLGRMPLSNAFVKPADAAFDEAHYPLHAWVCGACMLVQLEAFESPQRIFSDYVYFSSYADTWLEHCQAYAARMTSECALGPDSLVIEVASNDGYLLQYFRALAVPVLGIEPAANVAAAATAKGIPTVTEFFGTPTARRLVAEGRRADLIVANNVLAHVPDLNDFTAGFAPLLKPAGVLTLEFPHLLRLIEGNQFDTLYHEHFSYFSFHTACRVLARHGLKVHDVDELPTHGGSLRVHAVRADAGRPAGPRVAAILAAEVRAGLEELGTYPAFQAQARRTAQSLLAFLRTARQESKRVAGYGAPAKGNTLLNFCGIGSDLLEYTVDRSPHKQGLLLPGSRIPVYAPAHLFETRPDYVLILPWNLTSEVTAQMAGIRDWGGRFVVPIPRLEVLA